MAKLRAYAKFRADNTIIPDTVVYTTVKPTPGKWFDVTYPCTAEPAIPCPTTKPSFTLSNINGTGGGLVPNSGVNFYDAFNSLYTNDPNLFQGDGGLLQDCSLLINPDLGDGTNNPTIMSLINNQGYIMLCQAGVGCALYSFINGAFTFGTGGPLNPGCPPPCPFGVWSSLNLVDQMVLIEPSPGPFVVGNPVTIQVMIT